MLAKPFAVRDGLAILVLIVAPIGIHLAMATQRGMLWAGIMVDRGSHLPRLDSHCRSCHCRSARWAGCAIVLIVTTVIWRYSENGIIASSAIPHAIAYLSILTIFGSSLLPGRKPIITTFAERSRGELPPPVLRYTRRVTWAWCLFCAAQLLGSLLLLLFAPVAVWSAVIVNILNLPC